MKYFLIAIVTLLCCSCLVPGAPHWFNYKSNSMRADSVNIISYPGSLAYEYKSVKNDYDSILVLDPIHRVFRRMELEKGSLYNEKPYYSFYKKEPWNLKKIEKMDFIILKKYQQNSVTVDTLCYYKVR
jgi:hypothetical protein